MPELFDTYKAKNGLMFSCYSLSKLTLMEISVSVL